MMRMNDQQNYPAYFPPQHQPVQPGIESLMLPKPVFDHPERPGSGRLKNKVALISGGDSGIGRAVSVAFAKEGADVVIVYLNEHEDAAETRHYVEQYGGRCLLIAGDIRLEAVCQEVIAETLRHFGKLDILVNNAGEMPWNEQAELLPTDVTERLFRTNILSMIMMTKAALPHLRAGNCIINTASIVAYAGFPNLIEYGATKGAVVGFTRSLALALLQKGIRVNGVAPGPIWTPLIPSQWPMEEISWFGTTTPMRRAGQPVELAPAYVYLASEDASYVTGQMIHVNGGMIING